MKVGFAQKQYIDSLVKETTCEQQYFSIVNFLCPKPDLKQTYIQHLIRRCLT